MRTALIVARFALRESLRRRVFVVVALLTVAFLVLYGLGARAVFRSLEGESLAGAVADEEIVAGATMLGLACFATLFLGAVLAVFLTLGAVRGDAERGLLQPVLVRDVSRGSYLLGRWLGAAGVCAPYVAIVFVLAAAITYITGGWWPDRTVGPALGLAVGAMVLAALSVTASVALNTAANGIAVLFVFGAGLVAGLLGQIAEGLQSATLAEVSEIASWALPFEALYQEGLHALTAEVGGITGVAVRLGPFGGAQDASPLLWPYALAYLGAVGFVADRLFRRADL